MKEYRVEYLKPGLTPDKYARKIEGLLNEMMAKGWEVRFNSGLNWIFDREK